MPCFFQSKTAPARWMSLLVLVFMILGLASCGSDKIIFVYPDEAIDFQLRNLKMPALYMDTVTDMRPLEQRQGQGQRQGQRRLARN